MEVETSKPARPKLLSQFTAPFLQSRSFPYLWLGQLISILGSSVTMVILPIIVYTLTGSSTTMGLIMAAYTLPSILMLPISGWIVDRYNRIHIMLFADIMRFIVMSIIASFIFTDILSIQALFVLVALYGLLEASFNLLILLFERPSLHLKSEILPMH